MMNDESITIRMVETKMSTIMNEDSLRKNNYAQTMLYNRCERSDIARTYNVAMAAARINTTGPEVTSDGFYMDLMMTRGSDPLESKSTLGADHLAVKEVKPRSSQVAGRHAVIASMEEEEDPRIVWCGHLGQGLGTRRCGLGGLSQHLHILYTQEGSLPYDEQVNDCDIMLCN